MILVFGSNLAGCHGAGAALYAYKNCGAVWGQGVGMQGSSYAIPTKDRFMVPLPLFEVKRHVREFLDFAAKHPELEFEVTRVGCGLAGRTDEQMSPMFEGCLGSKCVAHRAQPHVSHNAEHDVLRNGNGPQAPVHR